MWDLQDLIRLEYHSGYSYFVEFDDGLSGLVDFSDYLNRGPVFEPLRNIALFRQARIEAGSISWPSGADIAPESLYERCAEAAGADARRHA